MTGSISQVILPGIGPVCPECYSRGHVGGGLALPLGGEVYTFTFLTPEGPAELTWDIDAARRLVAERPREPRLSTAPTAPPAPCATAAGSAHTC